MLQREDKHDATARPWGEGRAGRVSLDKAQEWGGWGGGRPLRSEDAALVLLRGLGVQGGACRVDEDVLDTVAGLGGALDVLVRANLGRHCLALGGRHGRLLVLSELLDDAGIIAQVLFAPDQDDRQALAEVDHLGNPLGKNRAEPRIRVSAGKGE